MEEELRNQKAEMVAQKLHMAAQHANSPPSPMIATALENQTELLGSVLGKPKVPASTIKIEPKVIWPILGDEGPGGREVEEFYEKLKISAA